MPAAQVPMPFDRDHVVKGQTDKDPLNSTNESRRTVLIGLMVSSAPPFFAMGWPCGGDSHQDLLRGVITIFFIVGSAAWMCTGWKRKAYFRALMTVNGFYATCVSYSWCMGVVAWCVLMGFIVAFQCVGHTVVFGRIKAFDLVMVATCTLCAFALPDWVSPDWMWQGHADQVAEHLPRRLSADRGKDDENDISWFTMAVVTSSCFVPAMFVVALSGSGRLEFWAARIVHCCCACAQCRCFRRSSQAVAEHRAPRELLPGPAIDGAPAAQDAGAERAPAFAPVVPGEAPVEVEGQASVPVVPRGSPAEVEGQAPAPVAPDSATLASAGSRSTQPAHGFDSPQLPGQRPDLQDQRGRLENGHTAVVLDTCAPASTSPQTIGFASSVPEGTAGQTSGCVRLPGQTPESQGLGGGPENSQMAAIHDRRVPASMVPQTIGSASNVIENAVVHGYEPDDDPGVEQQSQQHVSATPPLPSISVDVAHRQAQLPMWLFRDPDGLQAAFARARSLGQCPKNGSFAALVAPLPGDRSPAESQSHDRRKVENDQVDFGSLDERPTGDGNQVDRGGLDERPTRDGNQVDFAALDGRPNRDGHQLDVGAFDAWPTLPSDQVDFASFDDRPTRDNSFELPRRSTAQSRSVLPDHRAESSGSRSDERPTEDDDQVDVVDFDERPTPEGDQAGFGAFDEWPTVDPDQVHVGPRREGPIARGDQVDFGALDERPTVDGDRVRFGASDVWPSIASESVGLGAFGWRPNVEADQVDFGAFDDRPTRDKYTECPQRLAENTLLFDALQCPFQEPGASSIATTPVPDDVSAGATSSELAPV